MPYNLRKRTKPEPPADPPHKPKPAPAAKTTRKPKAEPEAPAEPQKEPPKKAAAAAAKKASKKEPKQEPTQQDEPEQPSVKTPKRKRPEPESIATKKTKVETAVVTAPPEKQAKKETAGRCIYFFGSDSCGELGLSKIGFTKKAPLKSTLKGPMKQVACGPMHVVCLTESGQVYTHGCNDEGALGRVTDGDEEIEATPTVVPFDCKIIKVTAGDSHSVALSENHQVFIWGNFRDDNGAIGLTPESDGSAQYKPQQIMPEVKFTDIASGSNHVLMLDVDGAVYSFGCGSQGQLGRIKLDDNAGDAEKKSSEIETKDKALYLTPQKVSLKDVDPARPFICDAVYAGNMSSFATNTDKKKNRLAGWGLNNYFQLGYKGQKGQLIQPYPKRSTFTCSTTMINVAAGQHHTLFLTKTGRVYSAGRHNYGMLGLGKIDKEVCPSKHIDTFESPVVDICTGINTSFAVTGDGKLFSWGMGGFHLGLLNEEDLNRPTQVTNLDGKKVVSVSTGMTYTSVLVEE